MWVVAPEKNQSRRLALDDAARAAARAADGRAHLRPARHADRLRHHGACATSCSTIRPIWCCRASTTAPTSARTSPTRAPSPPPSRARMLGIRSIAMSQVGGSLEEGKIHWETPLTHGPGLLARLLEAGWPKDIVDQHQLSAVPARRRHRHRGDARKGAATRLLCASTSATIPWGMPYFWFNFERPPSTHGRRHRPCRHRCAAHLGDAAVPRPHARDDVPGAGARLRSGARPQERGRRRRSLSNLSDHSSGVQPTRHRGAAMSSPRRPQPSTMAA